MTTLLTALVLALSGLGLLFPGLAVAMSAGTYTFGVALNMSQTLLLVTSAGPFFILFRYYRSLPPAALQLCLADWLMLAIMALRTASAAFQPWADRAFMIEVAKDVVFVGGFYVVGRMLIFTKGIQYFSISLIAGSAVLLPIYLLSSRVFVYGGRLNFKGGEAVGLSHPMNIWLSATAALLLIYLFKPRRPASRLGARKSNMPSRSTRVVIMALAGALALFGGRLLLDNGTRGAMLSIIVVVVANAAAILLSSKSVGWRIGIVATIVMLGPVAYLVLGHIAATINIDASNRFDRLIESIFITLHLRSGTAADDASMVERAYLVRGAVEYFKANPLLGCGYGCLSERVGGYPHNLFIEFLSEFGLLGLLLAVAVFAIGIWQALVTIILREDPEWVVLASIFIAMFAQFQVSYSFSFGRILTFGLGTVVSIGLARQRRRLPSADPARVLSRTTQSIRYRPTTAL